MPDEVRGIDQPPLVVGLLEVDEHLVQQEHRALIGEIVPERLRSPPALIQVDEVRRAIAPGVIGAHAPGARVQPREGPTTGGGGPGEWAHPRRSRSGATEACGSNLRVIGPPCTGASPDPGNSRDRSATGS